MRDTVPSASHQTAATAARHRDWLVARAACGDRPAFRCLYAFLAMPVWLAAVRGLPELAEAAAVTRAAFVELRHLAGYHHTDPRVWLMAITARRVHDRTRVLADSGVEDYDINIHSELCELLGPGSAIIRTGPRAYARVEDLDHTLSTIAAASHREQPTNRYIGQVHRRFTGDSSRRASHREHRDPAAPPTDLRRRDNVRNVPQRPTERFRPDTP